MPVLFKETISTKERLSTMLRLLGTTLFAGAMIITPLSASFAGEDEDDDIPQYQVKTVAGNVMVNKDTYQGFRRYHSECHRCHGKDALGHLGPELITPLKTMTYDDYAEVFINGRIEGVAVAGNVMPAFGTDVNLSPYMDEIYMYLKARSDGVLPPGRPERFDAPVLE